MFEFHELPLEVFHGEVNSAEARIYVRAAASAAGVRVGGRIVGPFCEYARTLQTSVRLVDRGDHGGALAETVLPDPCFWTPELPFLYRAEIELTRDATTIAAGTRTFAIRRLATQGDHLSFDGRRWVLRAVDRSLDCESPWSAWRSQSAACAIHAPDDTTLEETSRLGVIVVAMEEDPQRLAYLARWPSVGIALLNRRSTPTAGERSAAANLIVGSWYGPGETVSPADWSQVLAGDALSTPELAVPRIACRWVADADLAEARIECDRLQRDLAGGGEYAGYMILHGT
ncbi:MAG TPA: hypothetical protein VG713_02305 [Pirellulales bacterium]|nr:hypothetical protein [Pirellulales bacterium]